MIVVALLCKLPLRILLHRQIAVNFFDVFEKELGSIVLLYKAVEILVIYLHPIVFRLDLR